MLQVLNLDDFQPNFSRKTSESLAVASLADIDLIQYSCVFQIENNPKQCRICLQNNEDNQHVFVSPCKCIGTLKFVHQTCYVTWLEKQFSSKSSKEQQKIKDEGLQCEICKQKNYLIFQINLKCLSCVQVKERINKNWASFIIFTVLMVLTLFALILIAYFMQASNVSSFGRDLISTGVISCTFVFLVIMEIVMLYSLIINFFMHKQTKLLSFDSKRRVKTKKTKRVYPL